MSIVICGGGPGSVCLAIFACSISSERSLIVNSFALIFPFKLVKSANLSAARVSDFLRRSDKISSSRRRHFCCSISVKARSNFSNVALELKKIIGHLNFAENGVAKRN